MKCCEASLSAVASEPDVSQSCIIFWQHISSLVGVTCSWPGPNLGRQQALTHTHVSAAWGRHRFCKELMRTASATAWALKPPRPCFCCTPDKMLSGCRTPQCKVCWQPCPHSIWSRNRSINYCTVCTAPMHASCRQTEGLQLSHKGQRVTDAASMSACAALQTLYTPYLPF